MNLRVRIVVDALLILSVFVAPWWFVVASSLLMVWFTEYIEIILIGALIDIVSGRVLFIILAWLVYLLSVYAKPRMSFYHR